MIENNEATECYVTNGAEAEVVSWTSRPTTDGKNALETLFVRLICVEVGDSTLWDLISHSLSVLTKGLHRSLHLQLFSDFSHIYSLHSALCTLRTPRESNPQLRCFRCNALIQPVQLTTAPNLLYSAYLCFRFSELSFAPCLSVFSP